MTSSVSTLILSKSVMNQKEALVFDEALIEKSPKLPSEFMWPNDDLANESQESLEDPPIDLKGFFENDPKSIRFAAEQIKKACSGHGFFHVINHGVDQSLISAANSSMDSFFKLPLGKKVALKQKPGVLSGYSGAHIDRFSSKLPWKETFSFVYEHMQGPSGLDVVSYIKSCLGESFEESGRIYQRYCVAMKSLTLAIMELLAISLGVDRYYYRRFFEDGCSVLRGNNYPPCREASLTLGTGPHSDPNSLTILHQDQVGGLEIFSDGKWLAIKPRQDAFVVNIGDTFMALSNGRYKSCLHRAVVNKERARRSLVFFVNPKEDKVIKPPMDLLNDEDQETRKYPNFTWSELRDFTQIHYRADETTLTNFVQWLSLPSSSASHNSLEKIYKNNN